MPPKNELSKELRERLSKLSPEQVLKFVEVMEAQSQERQVHELEYETLKSKEQIRKYPVLSATESGELVSNLDNQELLDVNTRLEGYETSAVLQWDILQNMGIMPKVVPLTRIYKQLKVSHKGLGRAEKVSIATGIKQSKSPSSMFENLFRKRKEDEPNVNTNGGRTTQQ